jgi:hypothetical protein
VSLSITVTNFFQHSKTVAQNSLATSTELSVLQVSAMNICHPLCLNSSRDAKRRGKHLASFLIIIAIQKSGLFIN